MSLYTKKGYTTVKAQDPQTGRVWNAPVPAKGAVAGIHKSKLKKANKARVTALRARKQQIKEAKRLVPVAQRAKVNWSKLAAEAGL